MAQRTPHPQIPSETVPESAVQTLLFQGGGFQYAHSFSINHPLIAEHINIDTRSLPSALPWLCAHTMQGVEFSSIERDPPALCYPGTREILIKQVQGWLEDPRSQQRVYCLTGPAGAGKSALLQSLAERTIANKRHSGASLFLELVADASSLNGPSRLWTTISYRLATSLPSYALRMQQEIARDPKLVEQSMAHQFRSLIMEPIGRDRLLSESPYLIPIFIDGLDKYHQTPTQEQVIRTILDFVQAYPEAPLAWIIALRPERHILQAFARHAHLGESMNTIDLSIDSEDACKDVQLFLRGEFCRIKDSYDVIQPWPLEEDFIRLFIAASGLFIFAYTIICFCDDSDADDPEAQLDIAISAFSPEPIHDSTERDPLYFVHAMYEHILRNVPSKRYSTAKRLLGFLLLPNGFGCWTSDTTTLWSLCNIFNIPLREAHTCLSKFASVLAIPGLRDAGRLPIRFLHRSFAHYLTHRTIAKEFWIDVREVVADLWHCHLRALTEANTLNSKFPDPSLIQITGGSILSDTKEIFNFRIKFWENARRIFFHHLLPCPSRRCPSGPHYDALSDLRDPSLFLEVFQKIDFRRIVDGYAFPDVPYRFITFLNRLIQLEKDHPLRREGLVHLIDASQGWNCYGNLNPSGLAFRISVSHCDNDGYVITFKSYTNHFLLPPLGLDRSRLFSTREQPGTFNSLQKELGLRKLSVAISVMAKCGVMVDTSIPEQTFYYILPLGTGSRVNQG